MQQFTISKTDTEFANNVFLPSQTYRVCVIKAELGESREKKLPMTTLTCEIIEPEAVEFEGKEAKIAGKTFQVRLFHVPNKIGKQPESFQAQTFKFCDKVGITAMMGRDEDGEPVYKSVDTDDYYVGLEFDIPLSSEPREKRLKQTPEQKSKGLPGDVLKDGEGNPIFEGWQINARLEDVPPDPRPSRRSNVPFS